MIDGASEEAFNTIKASGVAINVLTEQQKQPFIEKVQAVYDFYIEKGIITMEEVQEIRATLKQ